MRGVACELAPGPASWHAAYRMPRYLTHLGTCLPLPTHLGTRLPLPTHLGTSLPLPLRRPSTAASR